MSCTPSSSLVELYSALVSEGRAASEDDYNFAFSPFSVSAALAMLYYGAAGTTYEQIKGAYFRDSTPDEIAKNVSEAVPSVKEEDKSNKENEVSDMDSVVLRAANRLYISKALAADGSAQVDKFKKTLQEKLMTEPQVADFAVGGGEEERNKINAWVASVTEGKVKDIIPASAVSRDTALLLVSSLYFKGLWLKPFTPCTEEGPSKFYRQDASGATVFQENIKYMETCQVCNGSFSYGFKQSKSAGFGVTLLEVPYVDSRYSMVFFMPDAPADLPKLEQTWRERPEVLNGLLEEMEQAVATELRDVELTVRLPYFRLGGETVSVAAALQALGVSDVFLSSADLSGINGAKNLRVSGMYHQTVIEIDENGTEAAAATAVGIVCMSIPVIRSRMTVNIDRSFLFHIRGRKGQKDTRSQRFVSPRGEDDVFFAGRVVDVDSVQHPDV
ncbi:protease inhibitor pi1 [Cystoisospora suis]|uniref:Protease inhibitor pi1 n=1 Tax=Cystoisospora suis TaxID=483139 RepID=A0A2C6KZH6_9APIC|nr:protease inhibitor pi1 [Cystoisospora suis]